MSEFSLFIGGITVTTPRRSITLEEVLQWIRSDNYKNEVLEIRASRNNIKAFGYLKKKLDYVTWSGTFSTRHSDHLIKHSGYIVIDFDHIQDPEMFKLQLKHDTYVAACFTSPSGTGLKAVIRIKDTDRHKEVFTDLANYFNSVYRLQKEERVDPSGSDVNRACFLSWDPEAFENPKSKVYVIQNKIPAKEKTEQQLAKDASDTEKYISKLVERVEASKMDICNDYQQEWLLIAFSLSILGEAGRPYFHRISQQNEKYSEQDTNDKFDNAIKTSRFTTPAKFVSICKDYGIDTSCPKDEITKTKNLVKDKDLTIKEKTETKKKKKKDSDFEWHDTVWYEDGGMKIKAGKYFDDVAPNFQVFIKYRTEDEQENVTWVLEIRKNDGTNIFIEVIHDDFCSARKLKSLLATKQLGFKLKDGHLDELQSYLFTKTQFSTAMKVIRYGYHPDSKVYFFANKAINLVTGEMLTPDQFGIVEANKFHLSIPQQTKIRQLRYTLTDQIVSFDKFWNLYASAHLHENAFLPVCFYIFSLFRDLGLQYKNFSPILFLKGGAGTGKSSMVRVLTAAFGRKQEGVNLKSKNTDSALVKLMSQTSNSIIWFDEFHNDLTNEGLLQAAYDNDGYHKSTADFNSIDTATVDIHSALALTSNYLPENQIFFSRCIFVPINDQKKTDDQRKAYDQLEEIEEGGLGAITVELLKYRSILQENGAYGINYNRLYTGLKAKLKGQNVPERFFANVSQVMAAPLTLQCAGKINLLEIESNNVQEILAEYLDLGEKFILRQSYIMNDSKAVSEFFEIIQLLFDTNQIHEEYHFRFKGDDIMLHFRKLYNLFSQKYRQIYYKSAPDKDTIQAELATLEGQSDWNSISKNVKFDNDWTGNSQAKKVSQSGSCRLTYKTLQENFGLNLVSRPGGN